MRLSAMLFRTARAGLLAGLCAATASCVPSQTQTSAAPEKPGWYGRMGYQCYNVNYCTGNLKAYVGIPVDWHPKARCVGGSWNVDRAEVVSGSLPPGLRINSSDNIVGVASRAGTWHLRVRFVNMRCAGKSYGNRIQDLHITTTGSTAPRSVR